MFPQEATEVGMGEIQLLLKSGANIIPIRQMNASNLSNLFILNIMFQTNYINKMVKVWGIVSSASTPSAKATELHLFCRGCRHAKTVPVTKGFSGIQFPRSCEKQVISLLL